MMRILISDHKEQMEADYTLTKQAILVILPDADIEIEPYGTERFYALLARAHGLITAFIPVDEALLSKAPDLLCVSQNSAGFSNVELNALHRRNVALYHIVEYCTREVSEHAIAAVLALNRNLPQYNHLVCTEKSWNYQQLPARRTANCMTLAIFGFGRIGRSTAELAKALGMSVLIVDPYVDEAAAKQLGVQKADVDTALNQADAIISHMPLTKENHHFFNADRFAAMKETALFVNVSRGGCVDEAALVDALERGLIAGAAIDVLEAENPDLEHCALLHRPNVILTPHSAFYSQGSIEKLHTISGSSLAFHLAGMPERAEGLVAP